MFKCLTLKKIDKGCHWIFSSQKSNPIYLSLSYPRDWVNLPGMQVVIGENIV